MGRTWIAGAMAAAVLIAGCGGRAEESAPTTATPTTAVMTTTTAAPTTTVVVATSTTTEVPAESAAAGPDPACVITVTSGDSLGAIANGIDGVSIDDIRNENWLTGDVIHPGDRLDVCIGNDVDDLTGASRLAPAPAIVMRQQERLNELFEPYIIAELAVDGDSGPLTRQLLCAARMGLGLPVSTTHLADGSAESDVIFEATEFRIPDGAATWSEKWILIDQTCQVMFAGEGDDRIVDIYPTSTGEVGFETRTAQALPAFRFDPALDNDGWHDSSSFPVEVDNPLNGNMYKPIYFNDGQAIHGAGYVPPTPRSKGCARTFPWHQDALIRWLDLDELSEATWREDVIGVTVTVQGTYRSID